MRGAGLCLSVIACAAAIVQVAAATSEREGRNQARLRGDDSPAPSGADAAEKDLLWEHAEGQILSNRLAIAAHNSLRKSVVKRVESVPGTTLESYFDTCLAPLRPEEPEEVEKEEVEEKKGDEKEEGDGEKGDDADEKGEDADEKGEDANEKGEDADEKGEDTDEKGEDTDEKGEDADEKGDAEDADAEDADAEDASAEEEAEREAHAYEAFATEDPRGFSCSLSGLAQVALEGPDEAGMQDLEFELPEHCRPYHHLVFGATSNLGRHHHLILQPDGRARWTAKAEPMDKVMRRLDKRTGTKRRPEVVSLSGVTVPRVREVPVDLEESVSAYLIDGNPLFGRPAFFVNGGLCSLGGALFVKDEEAVKKPGDIVVFTTPRSCRPAHHVTFTVPAGRVGFLRVDVLPSGDVMFRGQHDDVVAADWISLNGITYPAAFNADTLAPNPRAPPSALTLNPHWQSAAPVARDGPVYVMRGNLCVISGTVTSVGPSTQYDELIANVPAPCRPSCPIVAADIHHNTLLLLPTGDLVHRGDSVSGNVQFNFVLNVTAPAGHP